MNTSHSSSPIGFALLAKDFCTWCESGSLEPKPEFAISRWLSQLYGAGLLLVEVNAEDDAPEDFSVETTLGESTLQSLHGYYYREIFDPNPTLTEEPCIGDIGDDLLDIYKDIKRGLTLFELGFPLAAEWEWASGFRSHWGRHAAGGLLALHCLAPSSFSMKQVL